jgi:hypothetical protein
MGTVERLALVLAVLGGVALHLVLAWLGRAVVRPAPPDPDRWRGATRRWVMLPLAWLLLCGPPGAALFLITSFVFAFSSAQYRMVAVVSTAGWSVALGALGVGALALARTRALRAAVPLMLLASALGWCVAVVVEWHLSRTLGGR